MPMNKVVHAAQRAAFSAAIDVAINAVRGKGTEKLSENAVKLVNLAEPLLKDRYPASAFDAARKFVSDPNGKWMQYAYRAINEIDPHILKMNTLNLVYEGMFAGYNYVMELRRKYDCNMPWILLFDPTSACNLHCKGCWAAEYGNRLNLTYEVRMGILGHSSHSRMPETLEGQIIRKSDQIAYINHDIDDAMRAGILTNDDIPREISDVLGETHRERINTLVTDMIFHSRGTGELGMTPEIEQTMQALRQFMFERVYKNPVAKGEESKARRILQELYTYYIAHPEALPQDFQPQLTFEGLPRVVCDYIAGMTDKYAMYKYDELFIPTGWQVRG
jgi:hypothetical protein